MEKLNLIFLLFSIGFVSGAFREGDIVSSARRGQFSGVRSILAVCWMPTSEMKEADYMS